MAEVPWHLVLDDIEKRSEALKRKKTNADRIRSMTDEELARWLALHPCLPVCPAQTDECFKSPKLENCKKRWLDWLRQEVQE